MTAEPVEAAEGLRPVDETVPDAEPIAPPGAERSTPPFWDQDRLGPQLPIAQREETSVARAMRVGDDVEVSFRGTVTDVQPGRVTIRAHEGGAVWTIPTGEIRDITRSMDTAVELVVRVHNVPAPQGSFFARCVGKGRAHRAIVVADNKATEPWRKAVTEAAKNAMLATGWLPLNDATSVVIDLFLPRPASVKRALPHVRPDVDKLARSTLDALTAAEVFADDALAVDLTVRKRYADGRPAGATIRVAAMSDQLVIV